MTSSPVLAWRLTISATARRTRASSAAASYASPSSLALSAATKSDGRGRLPVWVVSMRSRLCFTRATFRSLQSLDQRYGAGGRPHFAFVDHISEDVARCGLRLLRRFDVSQVVGRAALGPGLQATRPGGDLFRRISGRHRVLAALQAGIDEVTGEIGDVGIFDVIGEHDRKVELPQQRQKLRRAKAVVAHLDDMTQRTAVEFWRQQLEEAGEVGRVEFFGRRELPKQRPKPLAKLADTGIEKPLDGVARFAQHAAIDGKARALDREHEARRHLARPFAERRRRLRAIERAVDLDRSEPLGGVGELLRVRQTLRIERTAPGFEGPAADSDANGAGVFRRFWSHTPVTEPY